MTECPAVACPQHCDQIGLSCSHCKEEYGDLLSGGCDINKKLHSVVHYCTASSRLLLTNFSLMLFKNLNMNMYIFMKYQDA